MQIDKKIHLIFFGLIVSIICYLVYSYLIFPTVGPDSGFYLATAREFYAGKIYFHEIGISYNPLAIAIFGLPYLFSENPSYIWHLAINMLVILSASAVLYAILKLIAGRKLLNIYFTLFFILISLVLDGKHVLLEPISVFFQLVALYFYLKYLKDFELKRIFLAGLFISLAFLSKQYGLFIIIPIGLDLLLRNPFKLKIPILLILGFLIPIVLFFTYLNFYGVEFLEYINYILGRGLKLDVGNGTGISAGFFSHPLVYITIIAFNLYGILIPVLSIKFFGNLDNKRGLLFSLAIISLSVLFFAHYWHYFQYIVPYWLLLFVYLFQHVKLKRNKLFAFVLIGISFLYLSQYGIKGTSGKANYINEQNKFKAVLIENVPVGSEVYLDGVSPAFYYLCEFKSIDLKRIGFTFPPYFFPKTIIKNLNSGAYIVVSKERFDLYRSDLLNCTIKQINISNRQYFIVRKI